MKSLKIVLVALVVVAAFLIGQHGKAPAAISIQDEKVPSPEVLQARDLKQRTRGEVHAELTKRVGEWDVVYDFPMYDGMKVEGSAISELVLGGNFVRTTIKASMMGLPVEAINYRGFDTLAEEHLSFSIDNIYTLASELRGKTREDGVVAFGGIMKDMMSPQGRPYRAEEKALSDDKYKITVYDEVANPEKEMVVVILTFTRKAAEKAK